MPASPFRPSADPLRQSLVEVRRGLLRLHKALIDAERASFERGRGPITSGQLLQALIQDPFFAWLQPFTRLLGEIDEVLAAREPLAPAQVRDFTGRVHALVVPPGEGGVAPERYEEVRTRSPDVLLRHVELVGRIREARGEAGEA